MKKILAVLLALVLAFGCTAVAFAAGSKSTDSDAGKEATWTCIYCKTLFHNISLEDQATHKAQCPENPANKVANPLRCPYCGNNFYDEEQYNKHIELCKGNNSGEGRRLVCPYCNNVFTSEEQYNAHIQTCYGQAHIHWTDPNNRGNFFNLSASQILDKLVEVFDINAGWWDGIEDVIIRLVDFIENIGLFASAEGDVAGAVDDLDAKVESLGIVGDVYNYIKDLITTLKQKIKDFYAGNRETEPVEETTGAEPVATGSSAIGIAAFAAVSVAAAAAYVCVKKKEN